MAKKKKQTTPWEIAKPILEKAYLEGEVTDGMKPADVWAMRSEFVDVKYKNFRSNFARMKKSIKENKERANDDEAGFLHDMTIYTLAKDSASYWDGSEVQTLLKRDIEKKRNECMKPELLWLSRLQYQVFALEKFRGHIHQELRSQRETNYWIVKRKKKKQAEEAKKDGKKFNDDDIDFHDPVLDM
jgi:hypothetical protein